jgi:lipopolysaccharide export system protein LptC
MDISRTDEVDAVRQALTRLMAIADRLETRNMQTVERIEAVTAALDQGARRLDGSGEQFARTALQMIGNNAQQAVTQGTAQALGEFRQQLQQTADSARSAAHAMDQQCKELTTARRSLAWNGMVVLLVGSVLAACGAAWVAHRSMQEMAQAHFGRDILQATQQGAITRCGDALCARVGKKPQRYGTDSQYLLLQK